MVTKILKHDAFATSSAFAFGSNLKAAILGEAKRK
jgi:hypothetical protein